jgi:hypothetical protein
VLCSEAGILDRFWLEFSAVIPWLGGAESDEGIGMIPEVTASGHDIVLAPPGHKDEIVVKNDTDRPLFFVVEDRNWARDALTGERVIAMPAFRRLCPEQLLRSGDDVEIGRVAIVFTDLQVRPSSTTRSAMPLLSIWCAITSRFCPSGSSATTGSSSRPSATR